MTCEYLNKNIAWHYFKKAQHVKDRKELVDLFNQIPSIKIQKFLKETTTMNKNDLYLNMLGIAFDIAAIADGDIPATKDELRSLSNELFGYLKEFRGEGK